MSYQDMTRDLTAGLKEFRKQAPETMKGFSTMAANAKAEGALDKTTKELIALAIAVARGCQGCIGFHADELVQLGAKREQVSDMLAMAVYMGGGPSAMYAAQALQAYDEFAGNVDNS